MIITFYFLSNAIWKKQSFNKFPIEIYDEDNFFEIMADYIVKK